MDHSEKVKYLTFIISIVAVAGIVLFLNPKLTGNVILDDEETISLGETISESKNIDFESSQISYFALNGYIKKGFKGTVYLNDGTDRIKILDYTMPGIEESVDGSELPIEAALEDISDDVVMITPSTEVQNYSYLCSIWSIQNLLESSSNVFCQGSSKCCSFMEQSQEEDIWNESVYINEGKHGASKRNLVRVQLAYVDYSFDLSDPSSDIRLSDYKVFPIELFEELEFKDACGDACFIDTESQEFSIEVDVEEGEIYLESYSIKKKQSPNIPPSFSVLPNISFTGSYTLDLSNYATDLDGDTLLYGYNPADGIIINLDGEIATITADDGFEGKAYTFFTANDTKSVAISNIIEINVEQDTVDVEVQTLQEPDEITDTDNPVADVNASDETDADDATPEMPDTSDEIIEEGTLIESTNNDTFPITENETLDVQNGTKLSLSLQEPIPENDTLLCKDNELLIKALNQNEGQITSLPENQLIFLRYKDSHKKYVTEYFNESNNFQACIEDKAKKIIAGSCNSNGCKKYIRTNLGNKAQNLKGKVNFITVKAILADQYETISPSHDFYNATFINIYNSRSRLVFGCGSCNSVQDELKSQDSFIVPSLAVFKSRSLVKLPKNKNSIVYSDFVKSQNQTVIIHNFTKINVNFFDQYGYMPNDDADYLGVNIYNSKKKILWTDLKDQDKFILPKDSVYAVRLLINPSNKIFYSPYLAQNSSENLTARFQRLKIATYGSNCDINKESQFKVLSNNKKELFTVNYGDYIYLLEDSKIRYKFGKKKFGPIDIMENAHVIRLSENGAVCTPKIISSKFSSSKTNISEIDDGILKSPVLAIPQKGSIHFNTDIEFDENVDLDKNILIQDKKIIVNSTALPEFNTSAQLILRNITYKNPIILKDGKPCSQEICKIITYENGSIAFNVSHFTEYTIAEGPYCGDSTCDEDESCSSCESDCGICYAPPVGRKSVRADDIQEPIIIEEESNKQALLDSTLENNDGILSKEGVDDEKVPKEQGDNCNDSFKIEISNDALIQNDIKGSIQNLGNCILEDIEIKLDKNLQQYSNISMRSQSTLQPGKVQNFEINKIIEKKQSNPITGAISFKQREAITLNGTLSVKAYSKTGVEITNNQPISLMVISEKDKIDTHLVTYLLLLLFVSVVVGIVFIRDQRKA